MNRVIGGTGFFAVCFLCLGIQSHALEQDVILKAEENKVEVSMGGSEDTAVSMRLSLEVEVTEGDAGVSFEFDPGIESSVKQYRYEKETGILNLYISGGSKQKIFQEEEFRLGKVVLESGAEGSASASVRVKEDSLEIVNDAYDRRQGRVNASPEQKISVGTGEKKPEPDEPIPDNGGGEAPPESEPGEGGSEEGQAPESGGGSGSSGDSGSHGSRNPDSGSTALASEPVKGRMSLENRHPQKQDVGIRYGTLQTAEPETDPGLESPEPESEEQRTEDPEAEKDEIQMAEPEETHAPDQEQGPDILLLVGTAVGMIAACLVICLMVLEYRRKRKRSKNGRKSNRKRK